MPTNLWVERSQRLYRRLLRLYPQAHRTTYAAAMDQLFADQCRAAYGQQGRLGVLKLWWRTLGDASVTIPAEHLADPQARLGLLEALPGVQLPWKGVALVLIPGLVFFVCQMAQLSGEDWFYIAFYRAAYVLMLPVLLVWLFTRRFPVWGLLPLGLLGETLWEQGPRMQYHLLSLAGLAGNYPVLGGLLQQSAELQYELKLGGLLVACLGGMLWLTWYNVRKRQLPRTAWCWLGVYSLLLIAQIGLEITRQAIWQGSWSAFWQSADGRQYLWRIPLWNAYNALPFLGLIFGGTLFVHRYGALSFLLPLGYLLPAVIFGRYGQWNDALPFYWVAVAVVVYRFAVALVAPVWLARSASTAKQRRAVAIPLAVALLMQMGLNVFSVASQSAQGGYPVGALDFVAALWSPLIMASGLALAIVLYQHRPEAPSVPEAPLSTTLIPAE